VLRIDLDQPTSTHALTISQLQMHARRHADEVALMCYSASLTTPQLFLDLIAAFDDTKTPVLDTLWIRDGRAYTVESQAADDSHPRRSALQRRNLIRPAETSSSAPDSSNPQARRMAAAIAFRGRGILPNRSALRQSIEGPTGAAAVEASAALHAAADALLECFDHGSVGGRAQVEELAKITLASALAQAAAGGCVDRPTAAQVARLLCDIEIRDTAIARAMGETAEPWVPMLIAIATHTPDEDAAEICALLAVTAYRHGALAQVAIDRTLRSVPDHRLAHLMLEVIAAGLPPEQLSHLADLHEGVSPGRDE